MCRSQWIGAALLACVGILGCGRAQQDALKPDPPKVQVIRPVVKEVTDFEEFTGRIASVASVDIRARVTGYLDVGLRERSKEGTDVQKDELLFKIDPRPYQDDRNRAKANLDLSVRHRDRLTLDYQRGRNLLPGKGITQEEFDKVEGDMREAEAAVAMARAALDQAERNLTWTEVKAPFDGRVSRQSIDPGNIVKADETVLTTIVSLDPIYAYFDVDERTMLRTRRLLLEGKIKSLREAKRSVLVGLADEIDDNGTPLFPHAGTLDFADNQVDPMSGTLRLRAEFANPHSAYNSLRIFSPGMFVRVRLPIGNPHSAVLVSERALGTDQGQSFVYVVNEKDEVEYRKVKVGLLEEGLRVIEDGLKPDERVIVSGLQRVRDKAKVQASEQEIPNPKSQIPKKSQ
jgi:RND family efflux transporter MFP subunit